MKKKILIVDDELSIRKVTGKILTRSGYDVELAEHGEEAIEKLRQKTFDLVILDMNMPRMNGLEFLRNISKNKITSAPVLMFSGTADNEQRAESYSLGVYDFIRKPEEPEVMLKRVENGLKIGEMKNFNEFIKVELYLARKLQTYLYPPDSLETENFLFLTTSRQLSDIGGDLYDYINFMDGRAVFFIADVSGHSISASMFTAIVKMLFRNIIKSTTCPGDILEYMNAEMSRNLPIELFVTMFCGLLDTKNNRLEYANAGHPKPYYISGNSVVELEGADAFLGPIPDAKFNTYAVEVESGSGIILYTDGAVDIFIQDDIEAGKKIMASYINETEKSARERYLNFSSYLLNPNTMLSDDCTLMLLEIK